MNAILSDSKDDRLSVYEIGYLIATSIPEEKVPAEADSLKKIITDAGATIVADEAPYLQPLEYTMRKKMVSGAYDKYDQAYFGWVKFELSTDKIEALKKSIEIVPSVLRMLLITTVRENTFLGKRAEALIAKAPIVIPGVTVAPAAEDDQKGEAAKQKKEAAPVSIEEMDKSIDEMVKEV